MKRPKSDLFGRIADETPFVVEWLINHGIRVWSVNEGEQRLDNHTDKLMNYIRFWQADGESEKTSIRTKSGLGLLVESGDVIDGIMLEEKKEDIKVIISGQELGKYFGADKSPKEMKDTILKLLDEYKAKQPPELAKPEKKKEQEK